MKGVLVLVAAAGVLFLHGILKRSGAVEMVGTLSAEGRLFLQSPGYAGQEHNNGSLALNAQLHQLLNSGPSLTVEPFVRVDTADSNRTHCDLRVCNLLYSADEWQAVVGIDKVFWGATEFVRLVDIVNQTDSIESIDNEEKLGQPMVHLTAMGDWGKIDGFLLRKSMSQILLISSVMTVLSGLR